MANGLPLYKNHDLSSQILAQAVTGRSVYPHFLKKLKLRCRKGARYPVSNGTGF